MSGKFSFETFVDAHSNIFNEYLSSVVAKLSKENEEYQALQGEIESLYQKHPKVLGVFARSRWRSLPKKSVSLLSR